MGAAAPTMATLSSALPSNSVPLLLRPLVMTEPNLKSMKIVKAGRPRKSRVLRLNIAIGRGEDRKFEPLPEDWARIEEAYGRVLSNDDRAAVVILVDNYFFFQPSEALAPPLPDAIKYLDRIEKAGKLFWKALLESENIPMTGSGAQAHIAEADLMRGVAIRFVQSHLGRYLKDIHYKAPMNWNGLLDVMGACLPAFIKTREYLTGEATRVGFVEGRNWNQLICKLTEFAKERRLPFGVSKFSDPSQASPFVRFVRELQRTFPSEFQRHEATNAALAEAITVARRPIKQVIASLAAKKDKSADKLG